MIKFLIKGILRDHHRSLFPIIIVFFGVLLTTVVYSFINGTMGDLTESNARFDTGHVKIVTKEYYKFASQLPNDLALTGTEKLISSLKSNYPDFDWTARIRFVGLLDVPDEKGETKAQNPIFGLAVNLLGKGSNEAIRLNLGNSIVRGHIPQKQGEILISDDFAKRMDAKIGAPITLLSTTSNGSMAVQNFIVSGTVEFGISAMDRGAMIADLADMQYALEMTDGASEILGFDKNKPYTSNEVEKIKTDFNTTFNNSSDKFSPIMLTLEDQNGLGEYLKYVDIVSIIIVSIFLITMSIVLLNTGLMSGIRRYGEVGVRLALGESKDRIYRSLLYESILIGIAGSVIGAAFGILISYYLQEHGLDISDTLRNSSIMMQNLVRARVNITSYYIGFVPGLLATFIGTALSGIQIFKRQTASLFKELEV